MNRILSGALLAATLAFGACTTTTPPTRPTFSKTESGRDSYRAPVP